MNNDYIVSILIPVYNAEQYINRCLDSIFSQNTSYSYEVFLVDDGSTDNTLNIINDYKKIHSNITVKSLEHSGITNVLNYGLDNIKSKYIMRMDSDDEMIPNRIQLQVDYMENNPDIDILGGSAINYSTGELLTYYEGDVTLKLLKDCNPLNHPTMIYRTESLNKVNLRYNNNYKYVEDYFFYVEALFKGLKFYNSSNIVLNYFFGSPKADNYYHIQYNNGVYITKIIERYLKGII